MNGAAHDSAALADADGDGYTSVLDGGDDCDDDDPLVHPGAEEECNLADDNCDGTADEGCPRTLDDSPSGDGIAWTCATAPAPGTGALWLTMVAVALARRVLSPFAGAPLERR